MGKFRREIIGSAELILGDCREVLETLGGIDAIVSDPPYGISYVKGAGGRGLGRNRNIEAIIGDDEPFDPGPFLAYRHVILFGADHYAQRLPRGRWLVWDKLAGVPSFDSFSDVEVAWQNRTGAARIFRHLWKGLLQDSEKGPRREHPTQKPVALMRWCIEQLPADAAVICDPFMGVGATGIAAVQLGRKFIGIEMHEPYFDVACRRIEEAASNPLFAAAQPGPTQPSIFDEASA